MNRKVLSFIVAATISVGAFTATADAASHKVQKGDTLWSISRNYGTTVADLKSVNNLNSDIIYPNQTFEVAASAQPAQATTSNHATYTIKHGDTLFSIAQAYGVSVNQLMSWNNIATADRIYSGDIIAISEAAAGKTAATQPSQIVQYQQTNQTAQAAQKQQAQKAPVTAAQTIAMSATAYTAYCTGCSGITANGTNLRANPSLKVIAVDPSVIPLGSRVWVEGYGEAIAADTGGAIKGNKIDVFIPSQEGAMNWGRRTVNVKILD